MTIIRNWKSKNNKSTKWGRAVLEYLLQNGLRLSRWYHTIDCQTQNIQIYTFWNVNKIWCFTILCPHLTQLFKHETITLRFCIDWDPWLQTALSLLANSINHFNNNSNTLPVKALNMNESYSSYRVLQINSGIWLQSLYTTRTSHKSTRSKPETIAYFLNNEPLD